MLPDPEQQLLHLTAVLTEPQTIEGRTGTFDDRIVVAINERRPDSALGWIVELRGPTRSVLHADIEAATEQTAAFALLTALEFALFPLATRRATSK